LFCSHRLVHWGLTVLSWATSEPIMDLRDLQLNFGANAVLVNSSRNVAVGTHNCGDFGGSAPSASRHTDAYSDFEVQDLSYSAQCLPMDLGSSVDPHAVHDDQDVSCIDLSLLLSSSKACDRQQIEDELPLNLTGKAREEEINRRLRQCQQFNYQFSSYSDPPRNVFLAPDFLGELILHLHSLLSTTELHGTVD